MNTPNRVFLHILTILAAVVLLAACGSAAEPSIMNARGDDVGFSDADAGGIDFEESMDMEAMEAAPPLALDTAGEFESSGDDSLDKGSVVYNVGEEALIGVPLASDRLIIKNANMSLLVEDTAVAIDRLTQVVGDFGGYIISSREWHQEWIEKSYKYATYTFAVPVDQFERTLTRLRALAITVLDEQASGQDVTQEFVDLESRLRNLEATRDRIRTFLDQATTVEEALAVNRELSDIEDQIEETKGRMNYLTGRASFSTITVTLNPELPEFIPTPTPTATITPTPTPSPTPVPWDPGETLNNATQTLGSAYRGLAQMAIWLVVVLVPIFAPFVLIGWGILRVTSRKLSASKEKK